MPDWTRRRFHQHALLGAGGLAFAGCRSDDPQSPEETGPRGIILITADDLGWRDLSSYGLSSVSTPGIDRLADEGIAFSNAFDVVSTCSSSRATLATGQYTHTHGVLGLVHRNPEFSLPLGTPTVASRLQDAGWSTALQGKWHLTAEEAPEAFGFDQTLPTDLDQRIRNNTHALGFLEVNGDRPFFLELNYMQTHRDLFGNFPQVEGYEVDPEVASPPEWWGLPDWAEIREEVAGYLSHLLWMDDLIGELLDGLDALGLSDDTLVCFVSDNGPAFPGCKTTVYDRGLGTPLMFRWPARLKPRWVDELTSTVDIAPTLLDYAGTDPLPGVQGRSLKGLLEQDADWTPTSHIVAEMENHSSPKPARSIRTSTHKLIRNYSDVAWGSGGGNGAWKDDLAEEPDQTWDEPRPPAELYDLTADPLERVNVIDDPKYAAVLQDLSDRLDTHMRDTDDERYDT